MKSNEELATCHACKRYRADYANTIYLNEDLSPRVFPVCHRCFCIAFLGETAKTWPEGLSDWDEVDDRVAAMIPEQKERVERLNAATKPIPGWDNL